MSTILDISVRVKVETQAELDRVLECVYSGLAGEFVRLGALYGPGVFMPPTQVPQVQQTTTVEVQDSAPTTAASEQKVTRVETKSAGVAPQPVQPVREKRKGLMGMRRLERV